MLRLPGPRERLLDALRDINRLVLLGDVLELRAGPMRAALDAAAPVLSAIGEALGAEREVVVVPGNHDHALLTSWLERRALGPEPSPMGLQSSVSWRDGDALAAVAASLQPARVRAAYPGVWLQEDVYATHGHYLDRHTTVPMLERLAAGAMAYVVGSPDGGPASAEDYERILAPLYAWIHGVAQAGGFGLGGGGSHGVSGRAWTTLEGPARPSRKRSLRRRAIVTGFPLTIRALSRTPLGPLRADVSGPELRRAALRACEEVLRRLGVQAAQVIFGHTHRAGPLPADESSEWSASTGARMINSGCWVNEPRFLGDRPQQSPYRPGFAVVVEDEGSPQLVSLLVDGGR